VNLQLSDQRIRATCRELFKQRAKLSGRQLCAELRTRYGAVGKTTRVFRIWREESANTQAAQMPGQMAFLTARVQAAETAAAEYLKRAELAEFREQAHQDHWAAEVDRLRVELATLKGRAKPFPV
jgi:hypothetical protein